MIASSTCAACEILGRCSRCRRLDEISKPPRWQIMLHGKLLLEMESKPEAEVVACIFNSAAKTHGEIRLATGLDRSGASGGAEGDRGHAHLLRCERREAGC